jgi:hypothetical protein
MTPEQEKQLKEALELARDNNKMLHKMRKSMIWSRVFKIIYLVIILGVTFGAYYFIQPYLEGVLGAYQSVLGAGEQINQAGNALPDISKLFGN